MLNKRALGQMLHDCGLWSLYVNGIGSVKNIGEFDKRFALQVAEEIHLLGIQCGESAQLNSALKSVYDRTASKCREQGIAVHLGIRAGIRIFPVLIRFHTDRMLALVNYSSRLEKASWCGLLDKYREYARTKNDYSMELLKVVFKSALSGMDTSGL